MEINFSNLNQTSSLSNIRTKFFTTLFTALITVIINISRDSNGLFYIIFRNIYSFFGMHNVQCDVFIAVKNIVSTFIRCLDVALNVIVIFYAVYFVLSSIQKRVYSKFFKKRKMYIRDTLWEYVLPNIAKANSLEVDFISKNDRLSNIEERHWRMIFSSLLETQREVIAVINSEGVFEFITDIKGISKHYEAYIELINFPLVYVIFEEEYNTILEVCKIINSFVERDDSYSKLAAQYNQIEKDYSDILDRINSNKLLIN